MLWGDFDYRRLSRLSFLLFGLFENWAAISSMNSRPLGGMCFSSFSISKLSSLQSDILSLNSGEELTDFFKRFVLSNSFSDIGNYLPLWIDLSCWLLSKILWSAIFGCFFSFCFQISSTMVDRISLKLSLKSSSSVSHSDLSSYFVWSTIWPKTPYRVCLADEVYGLK